MESVSLPLNEHLDLTRMLLQKAAALLLMLVVVVLTGLLCHRLFW